MEIVDLPPDEPRKRRSKGTRKPKVLGLPRKPWSPEQRAATGARMKARWANPEVRAQLSEAMHLAYQNKPQEKKDAHRAALTATWTEERKALAPTWCTHPCSPETKKLLHDIGIKRVTSDETRKKLSAAQRKTGIVRRMLGNLRKYGRVDGPMQDTYPERRVEAWLISMGMVKDRDYKHPRIVAGVLIDFFLMKRNLVLEVDGCYFHGHICKENDQMGPLQIKNIARDKKNTEKFLKRGFNVVRILECEIKRGDFSKLEPYK